MTDRLTDAAVDGICRRCEEAGVPPFRTRWDAVGRTAMALHLMTEHNEQWEADRD